MYRYVSSFLTQEVCVQNCINSRFIATLGLDIVKKPNNTG